jgi:hypothetical protein
MELTFQCPSCSAVSHVRPLERAQGATCQHCRTKRPLHAELIESGSLVGCPWCATKELYVQKDFPQGLGLFIVIVGFAVSTVFWYLERPVITYAVLLGSALLDLVLYYRVSDVTICYRCLSQVRGMGANPDARYAPFDLAVGERFRQERLRIEELRQRDGKSRSSPQALSGSIVEDA